MKDEAEITLLAAAANMTADTRRYVKEKLAKILAEEMGGYEHGNA